MRTHGVSVHSPFKLTPKLTPRSADGTLGGTVIETPTVLILGAGASAPYGFPVGYDLFVKIRDRGFQGPPVRDPDFAGILESQVNDFRRALSKCGRHSVDAFLEYQTDGTVELGKRLIACSLIPIEDEEVLFAPKVIGDHNRSWYQHLFEALHTSPGDFGTNELSVITFNYDRSLEHFITSALESSHKLSFETALQELRKIEIIHLHGSLGEYGEEGPRYSPRLTAAAMGRAMSSIRIVHQAIDIDTDPLFVRARSVLSKAKKVIVLGFGFLPANIAQLRFDVIPKGVAVDSSAYGMTKREMKRNGQLTGRAVRFGDPKHGVLDFLRHQISLG